MPKRKKQSFFEKLTGSIRMSEDHFEDEVMEADTTGEEGWDEQEEMEGQLSVDMYQTHNAIVIKAFTAGVKQNDLDISITREMVTIRGMRSDRSPADEQDYFHRELYWGAFSRTIMLPFEVDIEQADATEHNGLLTMTLPKIDKDKQTVLKVRTV